MHIRPILPTDAPAFLDLLHALDRETKFMYFEPGERTSTLEDIQQRIERVLSTDNSAVLVADPGDGRLAGHISASGGASARSRGTVYIVVGIRQQFTGQGLGARLFAGLEAWARRAGVHRLELTVMAHNTRGVALYQKRGFVIEGVKKHSMLVDGCYIDEYYMGKILID